MKNKAPAKSAPSARRQGGDVSLTRGEEAYQRIMDAIRSGALSPGARMREVEVAEWLGSSRTPVREALNRLQTEGLVVQEPRRGMIIAEMDSARMSEVYFMREVLEVTAARLAARHAADVEVSMLRDFVNRDKEFVNDPARLAKSNRLFHDALYRAAHNRYLLKTANLLQESLALLGPSTLSVAGRAANMIEEHDALVSAIERHDPDAAEAASRAHIRSSHLTRIQLMFERDSDG
jgi:DNA-binding GntR family transcriptional regulator